MFVKWMVEGVRGWMKLSPGPASSWRNEKLVFCKAGVSQGGPAAQPGPAGAPLQHQGGGKGGCKRMLMMGNPKSSEETGYALRCRKRTDSV